MQWQGALLPYLPTFKKTAIFLLLILGLGTAVLVITSRVHQTTGSQEYSVVRFDSMQEQKINTKSILTGKGIPGAKVTVSINPNGDRKEVVVDENGMWTYQIPETLQSRDYRLTTTILDKANHIVSVKVYKIKNVTKDKTGFHIIPNVFAKATQGVLSRNNFASLNNTELPFGPSKIVLQDAPEIILGNETDSNNPIYWNGDDVYAFTSSPYTGTHRSKSNDIVGLDISKTAEYHKTDVVNQIHDGKIWFESILKQGDVIYGFYHNEFSSEELGVRAFAEEKYLTAPRIGVARSNNNGRTWDDLGIIFEEPVTTFERQSRNAFFTGGIGDFSVIEGPDQTIYIFATSYHREVSKQGVVILKLTRNQLENFSTQEVSPTPIFPTYYDIHDTGANFFWGPSVHFNTHLDTYVMFLNHADDENWNQDGIYASFNEDISNPRGWSPPQKIHHEGNWYPQIIGNAQGETDARAGRVARYFEKGISNYEIFFLKPGETIDGSTETSPSLTPESSESCLLTANGGNSLTMEVEDYATFRVSNIPKSGVSARWSGTNDVSDASVIIDQPATDFRNDGSGVYQEKWQVTYGPYEPRTVGNYTRSLNIYDANNSLLCSSNTISVQVNERQQEITIENVSSQIEPSDVIDVSIFCSADGILEDCEEDDRSVIFTFDENEQSTSGFVKKASAQAINETILPSKEVGNNIYQVTIPDTISGRQNGLKVTLQRGIHLLDTDIENVTFKTCDVELFGWCPAIFDNTPTEAVVFPNTAGNTGNSCRYLSPPIHLFNIYVNQAGIDSYIARYSAIFINAGKGDLNEFGRRVNYIIDNAKEVGLNPVIFLGYWRSESAFSTQGNQDLGCSSEAVNFYEQVDCALGINEFSNPRLNPVPHCARSIESDTMACQTLAEIRRDKDRAHSIRYPIRTFDNFAEAYGPIADDPENCSSTYNTLIEVAQEMTNTPAVAESTDELPVFGFLGDMYYKMDQTLGDVLPDFGPSQPEEQPPPDESQPDQGSPEAEGEEATCPDWAYFIPFNNCPPKLEEQPEAPPTVESKPEQEETPAQENNPFIPDFLEEFFGGPTTEQEVAPANGEQTEPVQGIPLQEPPASTVQEETTGEPPPPAPVEEGQGGQEGGDFLCGFNIGFFDFLCPKDQQAPPQEETPSQQERLPEESGFAEIIQAEKQVNRIVIGDYVIYGNNLTDVPYHLSGTQGQAQDFVIPVTIYYSDGDVRPSTLNFLYQPDAVVSPEPTPACSTNDDFREFVSCDSRACGWELWHCPDLPDDPIIPNPKSFENPYGDCAQPGGPNPAC